MEVRRQGYQKTVGEAAIARNMERKAQVDMQAADDVRLETRAMALGQLERAPGSSGQGSGGS